ncbi:unnamed protein product [Trifolium pratense]|uniref:Uncharacterized protein n=1 Tax=Trifolium pratense TaxID=57577 RepID=A0ACB0J5Z5_TRIPR|nr:unnamed protein product [Trifolium pratense]
MQHLLFLSIKKSAFEGLHFEDGWFQKLKELHVEYSDELRDIIIDKGALSSLKKLGLHGVHRLTNNIPTGIQHLEKLEVLGIYFASYELQNISTEDWNSIQHVPLVDFFNWYGVRILVPRS